MKKVLNIAIKFALFIGLCNFVSCESMLDDFGNSISSIKNGLTSILLKPLPQISLFNAGGTVNAGDLIDLGLTLETAAKDVTLTVRNTGAAPLEITGVSMGGKYAKNFSVSGMTCPVPLALGGEATFTVTFQVDAGDTGYRASVLSISIADDSGRTFAPFNVTVACESTIEQRAEVEVWRGRTTLVPENSTYDMGYSSYCIFTVWNKGTAELDIDSVALAGATAFTLTTSPSSPVLPGKSANMRVDLNAGAAGTYGDTLTINYHDAAGSGTYTIHLAGNIDEVPVPQIEILDGTMPVTDTPPACEFGGQLLGTQSDGRTYTITNIGTGDLNIASIALSDSANPDNFVYSGPTTATIPPGGSTDFTVYYYPKAAGSGGATITVTSDDPDHGDWLLQLQGHTNMTVTYNGNGQTAGTAPVDAVLYSLNDWVTVLGNDGADPLEKTGYVFTGWNTKSDGTGSTYVKDSQFQMGTGDVTLYAIWTNYRVTYNKNGATTGIAPTDPVAYVPGDWVTVLGNDGNLAKNGYVFRGWNTKADGTGTTYQADETFQMTAQGNVTLYANWKNHTVTYEGNGSTDGQPPTDSTRYLPGDWVTVRGNTGNLIKDGAVFYKWNTALDGSGTYYQLNDTFQMGESDVTLYAIWTNLKVMYDGNGQSTGQPPTDPNIYKPGDTVTVRGNTGGMTKGSLIFHGWNTQPGGTGTTYRVGRTFQIGSADVALYAVWEAPSKIIEIRDGNGNILSSGHHFDISTSWSDYGNPCSFVANIPLIFYNVGSLPVTISSVTSACISDPYQGDSFSFNLNTGTIPVDGSSNAYAYYYNYIEYQASYFYSATIVSDAGTYVFYFDGTHWCVDCGN
jgi:uncharacterized repeat protein (TIGR02543 family)